MTYPNLMLPYRRHLQPRGSKRLLKSTLNAKNFMCMLFWSVSSDFGAIHSWNVQCSLKSQKITKTPNFESSKSFKVIDVGTRENSAVLSSDFSVTFFLIINAIKINAVKFVNSKEPISTGNTILFADDGLHLWCMQFSVANSSAAFESHASKFLLMNRTLSYSVQVSGTRKIWYQNAGSHLLPHRTIGLSAAIGLSLLTSGGQVRQSPIVR